MYNRIGFANPIRAAAPRKKNGIALMQL